MDGKRLVSIKNNKIILNVYIILGAILFAALIFVFSGVTTKAGQFENAVADYPETYNGEEAWWYHDASGEINPNVTTIACNSYGWWRVVDGKVDFDATGVYSNEYGWWYCYRGKVEFDYNGVASNEWGTWQIVYGMVDFSVSGLTWSGGDWYLFDGGRVCTEYTGIAPNEYGWWRVVNGKVDFNATGVYQNEYGWWYCWGGKVDFDYNGQYVLYEASAYGYNSDTKVQVNGGKAVEFEKVFIGDSRTVCIIGYGQSSDGFISKWSMAYDYFVNTEVPELENLLQLMPGIRSVEINMGANDIIDNVYTPTDIAQAYAEVINGLIEKYPDVHFYFASVYYIDAALGGQESTCNPSLNPRIAEYNSAMKEKCNAEYIPLQEFVSANKISSCDGLHIYSPQIRNYIAGLMA